ncbi:MAG: dihydropteroate synthase [Alphaproteobacteria bacterium]
MTLSAANPSALGALAASFADTSAKLYLRPLALVSGEAAEAAIAAGEARRLAGGRLAFTICEVTFRDGGRAESVLAAVADLLDWVPSRDDETAARVRDRLEAIAAPRPPFAGLPLDCAPGRGPLVMGIVNVTPDSFSDGGQWLDPEAAVDHGKGLLEAGADIVDVGGESSRPGAEPVAEDEELRRVLPVVRGLASAGALVSIDTRHARVMAAALEAGARIINDVTALTGDANSLQVAASSGAPVVLMHMQGEPRTMQDDPAYDDAPLDIYDYLEDRVGVCAAAGLTRTRIAVDPGIGFGKTPRHNSEILGRLSLYHGLGCGLLLGASRKRFVAGFSRGEPPEKRLPGSLAAGLAALDQGVQILRVHDVAETRQAIAVWDAPHAHS